MEQISEPVKIFPGSVNYVELPEKELPKQDYPLNPILNGRYLQIEFSDGNIQEYPTTWLNCGSIKQDLKITEDQKIVSIDRIPEEYEESQQH
jgi:hypothetical protein